MNKMAEALKLTMDALEMQIHGAGSIIHSKLAWQAGHDALANITKQEPVAWGWVMDGEVNDCIGPSEHARCEGEYTVPLYSGPVDAEAIRAEALEEAAERCEDLALKIMHPIECAAAIRSLK